MEKEGKKKNKKSEKIMKSDLLTEKTLLYDFDPEEFINFILDHFNIEYLNLLDLMGILKKGNFYSCLLFY